MGLREDIGMMRRLVALDIELDEAPFRAFASFFCQRAPAVEVRLLEVDEPAQAELERRSRPAGTCGRFGWLKISQGHQVTRFDACLVEGVRADGPHVVMLAGLKQRIP